MLKRKTDLCLHALCLMRSLSEVVNVPIFAFQFYKETRLYHTLKRLTSSSDSAIEWQVQLVLAFIAFVVSGMPDASRV